MKHRIGDFAVFGGRPTFARPLHVGRPNVGVRERFLARVEDVLDRRWLTNAGRYVQEFEERVADRLGVRHCIAMANGTVALELAVRACGLHGEVIVPSFTFIATAHALQWQEIAPVFCDIDPVTHNIDPDRIEALITPRTTAILAVHLWGRPAAIQALDEIARRHGLRLLFDAAHAFDCEWNGRRIGNFGDAEVLSFHATKFVNTLEGGAVVTNSDELASRLRPMKNFGFIGYDDVEYLGTNAKMNELSAAMGLTSLESIGDFVAANRARYETYAAELAGVAGIALLRYESSDRHNHQYVVIEVDEATAGLARDQLLRLLLAENIIARRYFYPGCHRMAPYRSARPDADDLLPATVRVASRVLCLPTGAAVDDTTVRAIAAIVRRAVELGSEVATRMGPIDAARVYEWPT